MKTKQLLRWVIVLFLLAALPGLTAVVAQGQEPAGKDGPQAPAVVELGESAVTIPYTNNETEPNGHWTNANKLYLGSPNSRWQHESLVRGGVISGQDDVDYWEVRSDGYDFGTIDSYVRTRTPVLFNIDAYSFGSPLDSYICLHDNAGNVLACNDDMQGATNRDSLLYYNLEVNRSYYLSVQPWTGNGGGPDFRYQLLISEPFLVSAAAAKLGTGYADGIPFKAGDVLAWSNFKVANSQYQKWIMLLDLSDLGSNGNLTNLAAGWRNSDYLLAGFAGNVTLPGISGTVTPWEVVIFDPVQVGPNTIGTFQRWWDGRQHGLSTSAEKIDAIDWPDWLGTARLKVSTVGVASVAGSSGVLKLADEDIGLWSENTNKWARAFDGTTVIAEESEDRNWGLGAKDVVAYSADTCSKNARDFWRNNVVVNSTGTITYTGWSIDYQEFRAGTIQVNQKSIVTFSDNYSDEGMPYWSVYRAWDGPSLGWNYAIDAIDYASLACSNWNGNE